MRDYNYSEKWEKLLTPEIVQKLTRLNEYKGRQRLFIEAHKEELKELIEIAKLQSTEASNILNYRSRSILCCAQSIKG